MWCAVVRRGASLCASGIRTYARRARAVNPGLQQRMRAFDEGGVSVPNEADLEDMLEESEADMQNAHQAYDKYAKEERKQRETLRRQIVHQKYVEETLPNLLTWSEKEQIRYLANEHPEDWTPERLAESFPVTKRTVKKLLKYPWKPASVERIERHDASAMRNWRELKEGTLEIAPELREHFLKFTDRSIPPLKEESVKPEISKEKIGEFQSIIEKCAPKQREPEKLLNDSTDEVEKNRYNPKLTTLDRLKENISFRLESGGDVDLSDQIILASSVKDDPVTAVSASDHAVQSYAQNDKIVVHFKEDPNDAKPAMYPERIRIPKNAWKKGGTYKVNDCYYDDDGRFLYRVPGIN